MRAELATKQTIMFDYIVIDCFKYVSVLQNAKI